MVIRITGTLTTPKIITAPSGASYSKTYVVDNAATGSTVTFKASGQSGVSVAVGEKCFVYYNGTDYVKVATSTGTGTVTTVGFTGGIVTVANPTTTPALTVAGTSGGVPYFTSASAWASSGALTQYGVVIGGGAGAAPTSTAAGTTTTVLHGNASGAPTFGAVSLTADVSGTLPVLNGGTNLSSGTSGGVLAYTASGTLASSGVLAQYGVVIGGGAGAVPTSTAVGTATHVLTSNGPGFAPTFQAPAASGATKGQAIAFSIVFGL